MIKTTHPTVVMLSGLPCSGKSTYRQQFMPGAKDGVYVASTDIYIEEVARTLGKTYNDVFKDEIDPAEKFMMAQLQHAIHEGQNIIWDQTNLTEKTRARKMKLFDGTNYKKAIVFFMTPLEVIKARNVRPGKIIPDDVIERMWNQFDSKDTTNIFNDAFWVDGVSFKFIHTTCDVPPPKEMFIGDL